MAHQIQRQAIGTTLTLIMDARPHWRKIDVTSLNGLDLCYIGFDRTLNTTNGHPLPSNQRPHVIFLAPGYQLWAIGGDATTEISIFETTDSPELALFEMLAEGGPGLSLVR